MRDDSYLFEQYLDGTMDSISLKNFLDRLAEDKDFAARFELYKRLDDFMRRQQLRIFSVRRASETSDDFDISELSHIEKEIRDYYNRNKNLGELRSLREKLDQAYENFKRDEEDKSAKSSWIGIAASIAVFVSFTCFYFFLNQKNYTPEELFQSFYSPYPAFSIVRGANPEIARDAWQTGLQNYEAGNFMRAVTAFELSESSLKSPQLAWLYEGICLMELKEYGDASLRFTRILASKNSLLHNHACWYLALCRLKQQRTNEALQYLRKIDASGDHFHQKANQLLHLLE